MDHQPIIPIQTSILVSMVAEEFYHRARLKIIEDREK